MLCCIFIIISILVGIGAAVLYALSMTPVMTAVFWLFAAIALVLLVTILVIISQATNKRYGSVMRCFCRYGVCMIISTLGSLFFSVLAAIAPLVFGIIFSAILVFLVVFFFTWMLLQFAAFLLCLIGEECEESCSPCGTYR